MLREFLVLFFLSCNFFSIAQLTLNRDTSVNVNENNLEFNKPWVGGMNSVQFNEIDLNLDGVNDIITFDRSGNKLNPFINLNDKFKIY